MKKRLLASFLAMVMVVTLLPISALATGGTPATMTGTAADPITNTNNGVTVSKYVSQDDNGQYKLTLEAYASDEQTTTTTTTPLDIVLVLDTSGSMGDKWEGAHFEAIENKTAWSFNDVKNHDGELYCKIGDKYCLVEWEYNWWDNSDYTLLYRAGFLDWRTLGGPNDDPNEVLYTGELYHWVGGTSKLNAMQSAVNNFIDSVQTNSLEDEEVYHQIGIVEFASQGYTRASLTNVEAGADSLKTTVNNFVDSGSTAVDYALGEASDVLSNARSDAKKVIVLFTDGEPNHGNGFDRQVAAAAINKAQTLKSSGVTIYTIGVFADARPDDTTGDFNKYMNAVSSRYPQATANGSNDYHNRRLVVTWGEDADKQYYFAADNAASLKQVFSDIADEVTTNTLTANPGADSVLSDTLSGYFAFPANVTAEVKYAPATAYDTKTKTFTFGEPGDLPEGAVVPEVDFEGDTITVTGFNYKTYAATYDSSAEEPVSGGKLVVSFPIVANQSCTAWQAGEHNYETNAATSLTYKMKEGPDGATNLVEPSNPEKVASPTVPVTAYTVTYESNGATDTVTDNQAYISGQTATVKAAPVYEDHTFNGWKTGDSLYQENDTFVVTGDVILTAQWTENVAPEPDPVWNVSGSKTAEDLVKQNDGSYTSDVTLSLPSAEEALVSDVVFVLDKSECTPESTADALDMLSKLYTSAQSSGATIKVGAVQFAGQAVVSCELTELTPAAIAKDGDIYEGLATRKIESGTNLQAGLLKAQELLAADTTVANNRKYVVVITDGLTRQFLSESDTLMTIYNAYSSDDQRVGGDPTAWSIANGFGDGEYEIPGGNWEAYFAAVKNNVETDGDTYAHEMNWTPVEGGYVPAGYGSLSHALCLDRAIYEAEAVYRDLEDAGYNCYTMFVDKYAVNDLGEAFVDYLNGGKTFSFDSIEREINYLVSDNSKVVDVIGDDFDFVNVDGALTMKVGNDTLNAETITTQLDATATYGFGPKGDGSYRFVVNYYANGENGASSECFVWEINESISNFVRVQLTYKVKLDKVPTVPGEHELETNESAILYPVDSEGAEGTEYVFEKPTVTFEVGSYNLIYDANGGDANSVPVDNTPYTAEREVPLDTETVPTHPAAKVNPDDTAEVPVKFIGWSQDESSEGKIFLAGQDYGDIADKVKFVNDDITVHAVWGYDTNGDGVADATQVLIQPADITIYHGGDGYAGIVMDENGNLVSNTNLPEPGYYFTLPYKLNEYLRGQTHDADGSPVNLANYIMLDDQTDATREWILTLYDDTTNSKADGKYIYRMDEAGTGPAKLEISKADGTIVTSDEFAISDTALYEEYTMALYTGAVEDGDIVVKVKTGEDTDGNAVWTNANDLSTVDDMSIGLVEGKLTVRGMDDTTPTVTTNMVSNPNQITADITAVEVNENTKYTINGSTVSTDGTIGLFTDSLLPNDVLDTYLEGEQLIGDNTKVVYRYLDLVDASNGNAYVVADQPVDIYWKLPADADPNGTFYVAHFNGLDRNYDVDQLASLVNDSTVDVYSAANEKLSLETIDGVQYIKFSTDSFSPFALLYDTATVTLSYNANGGSGTAPADRTVNKGTSVTVESNSFTNSGYTFAGWNTKADGTGTDYDPGDTITLNSNVILYAQWDQKVVVIPDFYTLHYESNGGTEYKDERYPEDTIVTLTKVPLREGYTFTGWYADEELTEPITRVLMDSDKTVYAGWRKTTVPDGLNGDDHFAYVIGYDDGTVKPLANIARSEVAAIFFRLLDPEVREEYLTDANPFTDVNPDDWYSKAVSTLYQLDIFKGRTATTFAPDAPITRAEFAVICARFDTGTYDGNANFNDIQGHWAEKEIKRAASLGWIMGAPDGNFYPDQLITRAEAMTMINRVLNRIPEDESDLLNGMNVWPDNPTSAWYYLAVQEATNTHDYVTKGEIYETWTKLLEDPDWTQYQ